MHRWPFCVRHRAYKVISGVTLQPKHHYVLEFMLYKNHIALMASQLNEKWDKSTMRGKNIFISVPEHSVTATVRSRCTHVTAVCPHLHPPGGRHFSLPQPLPCPWAGSGGGTCGCWRNTTRRESSERCKEDHKEHRGGAGGEKTRPGFPFNLLINHANEILTGYSEAFLRGAWKALVPDYTVHVKSRKKVQYAFWTKKRWGMSCPVAATHKHRCL